MIVDNERSVLEAVTTLLQKTGYQVTKASCGQECLDELAKGFKGVILMDVSMPGMDGWTTIHKIVSGNLTDGNAICMLTAISEVDPSNLDIQTYVMDYLAKPFNGPQLITMVESAFAYLTP